MKLHQIRSGWMNPGAAEMRRLFEIFTRVSTVPVFVDISGPELMKSFDEFSAYCRDDDAILRVLAENDNIAGHFLLRDIQFELELANLDIWFCDRYPEPASEATAVLNRTIEQACGERISRVQLVAMPCEYEKIALCESLGFRREGLLRQQFFYAGRIHDLVVLGRCGAGRLRR